MIGAGVLLLLFSISVAISVGAVSVPLQTVWSILINQVAPGTIEQDWSKGRDASVWVIRFTRALLAGLGGAG